MTTWEGHLVPPKQFRFVRDVQVEISGTEEAGGQVTVTVHLDGFTPQAVTFHHDERLCTPNCADDPGEQP